MQVKIPSEIFKRAGKSEDNINTALVEILGYFTSKNRPDEMFALLNVKASSNATVEIDDETIDQVNIKFKSDEYDRIVTTLLVFSYSVGGMQ